MFAADGILAGMNQLHCSQKAAMNRMPTLKSVLCALSHNESDNAMHGLTLCWFLDSCIWSVVHMHKHDRCWWGHAVPQTTRSQMPTITKFSLSFNVLKINSFVTCAMYKASAMLELRGQP